MDEEYRVILAEQAENDYHREKIDSLAALNRRIATIVARAKMATNPPQSWYQELKAKLFFPFLLTNPSWRATMYLVDKLKDSGQT